MTLLELFQGVMECFDWAIRSEFVAGAVSLFALCVVLRYFWLLCVKGGRRDG